MSGVRKSVKLYAIIHHPTHMARPFVIATHKSCAWSDAMFDEYVKAADEVVKRHGGGHRHLLSKRDLERWIAPVPCGARAQVVEVDVPLYWLEEELKKGPPEMK